MILKAYDRFKVDVANLSSYDLFFISDRLNKAEFARNADAHPILNRLVSANIQGQAAGLISPPSFIIKEVPNRKAVGSKPIKVAFIGLSEQASNTPKGFQIGDPVEAAKRAVPEARKRADVTVLLAYVKHEAAERIAREVPGIDVIIVGNAQADEQMFYVPFRIGTTLVAFTPYETRMFGELRFYRDEQSHFTVKDRYISLDGAVPDDSEGLEIVNATNNAETDARKSTEASLKEWLASTQASENAPRRDSSNGAVYATSSACSQCHLDQYIKWNSSDHARTTGSLVPRPADFDASCLACHASGHKKGALPSASHWAAMQNVQCEQCHGPGKNHIAEPTKAYGKIADIRTNCTGCHTPETSPKFELKAYWDKIKH